MTTAPKQLTLDQLGQPGRILALAINSLIAWLIFYFATGSFLPTGSGASIWLISAVAYWLLRLIAAPHDSPPKESIGIAVGIIFLLAPLDFSSLAEHQTFFIRLTQWTINVALIFGLIAVYAAVKAKDSTSRSGRLAFEVSKVFGRGEIVFTLPLIISALAFFQNELGWASLILGLWTFEIAAHPIELILRIFNFLLVKDGKTEPLQNVGKLLRVDAPNIVRFTLTNGYDRWNSSNIHQTYLPSGEKKYVIPLFVQVQQQEIVGTGLSCVLDGAPAVFDGEIGSVYPAGNNQILPQLTANIIGGADIQKIVGIVVEGSSIGNIKFQVLPHAVLEEGLVVYVNARDKRIYYQILDANTKEESFESNPFGVHVATASQLGVFDNERGFINFPWLPEMNQPVLLMNADAEQVQEKKDGEFFVGDVPSTPFRLSATLKDICEYHTAVLGMTGKGKTELALEIIRNAIDQGTKVFCVDFTEEYRVRLKDYSPKVLGIDVSEGTSLAKKLFDIETGKFGAPDEKKALQEFLDELTPKVTTQIETFLTDSAAKLGIFELAEITNSKATIRTTEIYLSAIMAWAQQHRKLKQIMIVLEEAHTIISGGVWFRYGFCVVVKKSWTENSPFLLF